MAAIKKEVELLPFTVPNYVIQKTAPGTRQEGWREAPKYHISELDRETLEALCAEFREAVLAKAAAGNPSTGDKCQS